jgi:bifunctional non-homologous end joining protein LigD
MSLREYKKKRNFSVTAEPAGKKPKAKAGGALRFVIQKHDASRLHYDFRLEMDGTLKSWAVPKGLPWAKGEKHLAVQVEDHPIEYGGFEGIIPKGQYGGGTVMLWDRGTYEPGGDDNLQAWKDGRLHFYLNGEKAKGEWSLVRMHGEENQWLLIKSGENVKPISARRDNQSVATKRTMLQIAKEADATWNSNRDADETKGTKSSPRKVHDGKRAAFKKKVRAKSKRRPKLKFLEPMKAKLVEEPPAGDAWVYEVKFDGYRALALKSGDEVQLLSRNNKDFAKRFPEIVEAVKTLAVDTAILDGEVTALDKQGHTSFQLLQGSENAQRPPLVYYVFDILQEEGDDLKGLPLIQRKERLQALLKNAAEPLRYSATLTAPVDRLLREVRKLGLEGLIGKKKDSRYEVGARTGSWVKIKCLQEQEFVIGGYTPPGGTRPYFGALLVGYFEKKKLIFSGKVGTGFNHELLKSLHAQMKRLEVKKCPFVGLPESDDAGRWQQNITPAEFRRCHWVKPQLVAQLKFTEWTSEGKLRHPVFLGLREDKTATDVRREIAE